MQDDNVDNIHAVSEGQKRQTEISNLKRNIEITQAELDKLNPYTKGFRRKSKRLEFMKADLEAMLNPSAKVPEPKKLDDGDNLKVC